MSPRLYLVSAFSGSLLVSRSFDSHAEAISVADAWERAGYVVELRHPRAALHPRDVAELGLSSIVNPETLQVRT